MGGPLNLDVGLVDIDGDGSCVRVPDPTSNQKCPYAESRATSTEGTGSFKIQRLWSAFYLTSARCWMFICA